jgi:hypothetical protein
MTKPLFVLNWHRDAKGYRILPRKPAESAEPSERGGDELVPIGSKNDVIYYQPLKKYDCLYLAFAAVKTPERLCEFYSSYGPLHPRFDLKLDITGESNGYLIRGDPVASGLSWAELFRELVRYKELGKMNKVGSRLRPLLSSEFPSMEFLVQEFSLGGTVGFVVDQANKLQVTISPRSLLGGMWWQLLTALFGSKTLSLCRHCQQWFEAGAGTGRRADATFCSQDCKIRHFSLARTKRPSNQPKE